jgi:hypothetical protein
MEVMEVNKDMEVRVNKDMEVRVNKDNMVKVTDNMDKVMDKVKVTDKVTDNMVMDKVTDNKDTNKFNNKVTDNKVVVTSLNNNKRMSVNKVKPTPRVFQCVLYFRTISQSLNLVRTSRAMINTRLKVFVVRKE